MEGDYMIGVFFPYNLEYRCYKCGEKIEKVIFAIHKIDKAGTMTMKNYHLSCAPKKEMNRILRAIERRGR